MSELLTFQTQSFKTQDGKNIVYYKGMPEKPQSAKGVVLIVHGLGEHALRYKKFASFLQLNGFAVYANDHRGHGLTAANPEDRGYTQNGNFWGKTLKDILHLHQLVAINHPELPIFFFAHSMGSLLIRDYITTHQKRINGVILSGTAGYKYLLAEIGLFITRILKRFKGRKKKSELLRSMMFNDFNRPFKPNRTELDWISSDNEQVDTFVNDPLRLKEFSIGLFWDLLKGTKKVNRENHFKLTPNSIPILLFSGENDPVGEMGKGVARVYKSFQKQGIEDLKFKLYKEGRHEMLNEVNFKEVYDDVLNWLQQKLSDNGKQGKAI